MRLYGSGTADFQGHGNANLPIVFAGRKARGKLERYSYDLDNAGKRYAICNRQVNSNTLLSNLLLTLVYKFGDSTEDISDAL